jgi:hypothetical protein
VGAVEEDCLVGAIEGSDGEYVGAVEGEGVGVTEGE